MMKYHQSLLRRIAIGLCLIIPAVGIPITGLCAQRDSGQPAVSNPADVPKAVFPEKTHDFGTVLEGDKVQYDFVVENHGTVPLQITKVQPD